jgi:hypothetical protein
MLLSPHPFREKVRCCFNHLDISGIALLQQAVTRLNGAQPHGFFCLSSVRDGLSDGAWLRLGAHRSGGGKAEGASPSRRILSWAVPSPLFFPCLSERDEWPTTPVSGVLGKSNTRIFRCCSPGNVPAGAEAFPDALVRAAPLPKVVDWLPVPSEQHIALHSGSTRSCFYPRPYAMEPIPDSVVQGATSLFSHG